MNAINAINTVNVTNTFVDNTEYLVQVLPCGVVVFTELDEIILDL